MRGSNVAEDDSKEIGMMLEVFISLGESSQVFKWLLTINIT